MTRATLLTCSTGRPQALSLCRYYVERQTLSSYDHVIAEGSDFWNNMRVGLSQVAHGPLIIFEDDDWYPPHWAETCVNGLRDADLFGQGRIFNYHVPTRGYMDVQQKGAPFHATAIGDRMLPLLRELVRLGCEQHDNEKPRLDVALWSAPCFRRMLHEVCVVSMKGMPGNLGYSPAHHANAYRQVDSDGKVLLAKIGNDVDLYKDWLPAC